MKSEAAPIDRSRPLHAALADLRNGKDAPSVSALARELGVAPSTLQRIYAGTFVDLKGKPQEAIDAKQRRAWAETITNIAQKISDRSDSRIEPAAAIREFGLDPVDKVINAAITRGIFDQREAAKLTDTVLANIEARREEVLGRRVDGVVRTGVLSWSPISERENNRSFGHSYCKRLVGTLNPRLWDVQYVERDSIHESLEALLAGRNGDDLTFGVYSTVSRQLKGLDFLPVPGIGIPLHALYFRPQHLAEFPINWSTIGQRTAFEDVGVQAYVLEEEVGELYLRGPCGYSADDEIIVLSSFKHDVIADALRNPPADKITLFVADRPTCIRVALAMRRQSQAFRGWSIDDATFPGTDFNDPGFPVYRLGMAFRADSERWASLLKNAIQEELFRNDHAWTASLYADLISRSFKELSLVPLEPLLPGPTAVTFAKKVRNLLISGDEHFKRRDRRLDRQTRDRLHIELSEIWGLPPLKDDDASGALGEDEKSQKGRSTRS